MNGDDAIRSAARSFDGFDAAREDPVLERGIVHAELFPARCGVSSLDAAIEQIPPEEKFTRASGEEYPSWMLPQMPRDSSHSTGVYPDDSLPVAISPTGARSAGWHPSFRLKTEIVEEM